MDWIRTLASRRVSLLLCVGLVTGVAAGVGWERLRAVDSHSATAVVLTGRVILSNVESRWIVFYPDGVEDPDNDADFIWHVIAGTWQDAAGGYYQGVGYPPCLIGDGSVEANPRRVELTTIDWDNGTRQPMHVALSVRCLD